MKQVSEMDFNELVDFVAGDALTRLIKGENWRAIIFQVVNVASAWQSYRK